MNKIIDKKSNKKNNFFKNIFVKYTVCFALISLFIMIIFFQYKKGFMWPDGINQHMINLSYLRTLIIEFFKTGKFHTFTWSIGGGIDLFANLTYFILGDFLSYFSIFFPENKLYLLYYILGFARIYLVGISFIFYCKYKKFDEHSTLIGALMYAFCGYCLFGGFRHPYFTNSVAVFPLIMIGIEKLVKENKKAFYIFSIALATLVNFYFAYSFFIIIGIYSIILTIYCYKKNGFKFIIKKLFQILIYSILGILLVSVILIPTAYLYLTSSRVGFDVYPYTLSYYKSFLPSLVTFEVAYWRIFTVHAIILISLPYFIKHRKENYPIFLLLIILLIPLLISQVGSAFMGFSFPNNRWSFVVSFLFAYMTCYYLNNRKVIEEKDKKFIIYFNIIYLAIIFISNYKISNLILFSIIEVIITMVILFNDKLVKNKKKYERYTLAIIIVGLCYYAYALFGVENNNYSGEFVNFNAVEYLYNTNHEKNKDFKDALQYIKNQEENNFYRLYVDNMTSLDIPLKGNYDYNSLEFYYSIQPKEIWKLSDDLKNSQQDVNKAFMQFDNRTKITTILGNKYFIFSNNSKVPYGYELLDGYQKQSKIYENKYALPFITFYDKTITNEEYENLTPLEKESSIMKQVSLDEFELKKGSLTFTNEILNFPFDKKSLEVKNPSNDKIMLNLSDKEKIKNSEVYVYITGLKYIPQSKKELLDEKIANIEKQKTNLNHLNEIAKLKYQYKDYIPTYNFNTYFKYNDKTISIGTVDFKTDAYYVDHSTLLVNLGYFDEFNNDIELSFSKNGTYNFDNIEVVAVSMDNYENDIQNLKRSNFKLNNYDNEHLEGTIELPKDGIIQFSTLYSKGWEIYIDDERVDSIKLNNVFLGAKVTSGKHKVFIKYHTPYLKEGFIITLGTSVILLIIGIYSKRKKEVKK